MIAIAREFVYEWREVFSAIASFSPFVLAVFVELFIMTWFRLYTQPRRTKRFVYCDGCKSKVLWVEMVNARDFARYEQLVGYGIIDMNSNSIYFDARQER